MKKGDRVEIAMVSTQTKDRADRHNHVIGTLLFDIVVDGLILVAPTEEGDTPSGLATSMVKSIEGNIVSTRNSVYTINPFVNKELMQ